MKIIKFNERIMFVIYCKVLTLVRALLVPVFQRNSASAMAIIKLEFNIITVGVVVGVICKFIFI